MSFIEFLLVNRLPAPTGRDEQQGYIAPAGSSPTGDGYELECDQTVTIKGIPALGT